MGSYHDHKADGVQYGYRQDGKGPMGGSDFRKKWRPPETVGWRPTCDHYDRFYYTEFPQSRSSRKRMQQYKSGNWQRRVLQRPGKDRWYTVPAMVLDPFVGSGTTVLVASRLGRDSIGLELNPVYVEMARHRVGSEPPQLEMRFF